VAPSDSTLLRSLGRQLGEFVLQRQGASRPTPAALQGVVADLAAGMPELQAPLRDLVSRQSFGALLPHARSGGGSIQRDALIQEISRVYHPTVLVEVEEVLNGFLDASGGITTSLTQSQVPAQAAMSVATTAASQESTGPSSSPPVASPQSNQSSLSTNQAAPSARKIVLVAISIGVTALAATGIYFVLNHLLNPSASCSSISDKLEPLSVDTSEFKKLIADNKEACAGDSRFLVQEAILRDSEGNTQQALRLLDQAIKIDPLNSNAFGWQGIYYNNTSDYGKALISFNRALELDSSDATAAWGKGDALSLLNRSNEAVSWYSEAIKLDPASWYAYRERGREKGLRMKQYKNGLEDLDKAIQIADSDAESYRIRAYIKTWLDDFTGACADIKKAKQLGMKDINEGGKSISIDTKVSDICS
jgi:Tfp pilus assembly protein PilF